MKIAKYIIDFLKFICGLSALKMLIILAFLSFVIFLAFEYLILDNDSKMLPESFHPQEEIKP